MTTNEPKALAEIHAIRERIYEKTRGMSPVEYNAFVNREVRELVSMTDIKIKRQNFSRVTAQAGLHERLKETP
jgi:hypothetical protein